MAAGKHSRVAWVGHAHHTLCLGVVNRVCFSSLYNNNAKNERHMREKERRKGEQKMKTESEREKERMKQSDRGRERKQKNACVREKERRRRKERSERRKNNSDGGTKINGDFIK